MIWLTTGLLACATSPTGRTQMLIRSGPEMASMGTAAFQQMQSELPRSESVPKTARVRCVAESIVAVLTPEELAPIVVHGWEVELFEDPTANAFALPGGKMGVHTGLLEVAVTPSQLAAVMGHEVGHVLARHGNERVSQTTLAQGGLIAVAILTGADTPEKQQVLAALGVGTQLGLMKFSRDHESEADELGLRLMARAGFDPREAVTLWQRMGETGGPRPPEFASTHPSHATRIRRLQASMPRAVAVYEQVVAAGGRTRCR
jgi:predicted Zn-dependent protease